MAVKDNYSIDNNKFLDGFQQVFNMNNENQETSTESTTTELGDDSTSTIQDSSVRTVDPSFFEEEEDESVNDKNDVEDETENETEEESEEVEGQTESDATEETEENAEEEEDHKEEDDSEAGGTKENQADDSGVETDDESEIVDSFFDLFAEELGWEYSDEDKPKDISGLVNFMDNLVKTASQPQFANEEVQKLNDFVHNGGNLEEYFKTRSESVSLANLPLEDNDENQRKVVKEHLKQLGFSEDKINKRIERYEDTGILDQEAEESQELLKKYDSDKEEKLLKEQENKRKEAEKQQQKFISDVETTIDEIKDIKGVPLTKQQKEDLKKYIFEVDKSGQTQYQKDYSQSYKNLIEAAFFVKEGEDIMKTLKRKAGSDATKTLKNKLNKRNTRRSKNQSASSGAQSQSTLDLISQMSKSLTN